MADDLKITPAESMILATEFAIRDMINHRCKGTEAELLVAAYLLAQSATQLLYQRVKQDAAALKLITDMGPTAGGAN